jgi:predicted NACHT family NTPase
MELIPQTVFKKAVSSAIVNGVKSLCNSISNSIFESKEMGRVLFEKSNFSTLIEADIESIENEINSFGGYPNINSENICVFFEYPEIESIIRQIYATNFPCISSHEESIEAIKDEFILLLAKYFNIEKEKIAGLASILFEILIEGCHETIKNQISNGKNIAFEALSNYQMKLILDELETINKNIDLLSRNDIDPKSFQEFFKKYTELLKKRHEWIATSTFEGNTRKPINKIYVCPDIINRSNILKTTELNNQYEDNQMFEFFEFLSKIHRVVLLGDPGNGKTTFTKKVCYELSARYSERLFSGREIVPFVVVVKDYHAEKIRTNVSIIEFVSMELRNDFQINPPENAIEYLLFNVYIFLIFDGLDEILDIKAREKMVNEIESFCNLYPSIPVIITSRKIGYEEAALRNDMFEIWELASFNINQIQEYVEKWFNMDDDLRLTQKNQKIDSFMKESEKVSDLRSNSLMLALMCNIYKQENYIPENRPRIYQKCAEMLYKKWDRSRGITPKMRLQDSKLEPLISYLAYWIYTNDFSNGWTTESELVNKAAEYLHHATYEDYDDAKEVAKDFIDFSKGRAWIFTYVGIVKNQNVYQFTHRTFLEYFTAEWLCRVYEETDKFTNELVPKIGQRQWDVVAQLAFQIRGEKSENDTDKILLNILD